MGIFDEIEDTVDEAKDRVGDAVDDATSGDVGGAVDEIVSGGEDGGSNNNNSGSGSSGGSSGSSSSGSSGSDSSVSVGVSDEVTVETPDGGSTTVDSSDDSDGDGFVSGDEADFGGSSGGGGGSSSGGSSGGSSSGGSGSSQRDRSTNNTSTSSNNTGSSSSSSGSSGNKDNYTVKDERERVKNRINEIEDAMSDGSYAHFLDEDLRQKKERLKELKNRDPEETFDKTGNVIVDEEGNTLGSGDTQSEAFAEAVQNQSTDGEGFVIQNEEGETVGSGDNRYEALLEARSQGYEGNPYDITEKELAQYGKGVQEKQEQQASRLAYQFGQVPDDRTVEVDASTLTEEQRNRFDVSKDKRTVELNAGQLESYYSETEKDLEKGVQQFGGFISDYEQQRRRRQDKKQNTNQSGQNRGGFSPFYAGMGGGSTQGSGGNEISESEEQRLRREYMRLSNMPEENSGNPLKGDETNYRDSRTFELNQDQGYTRTATTSEMLSDAEQMYVGTNEDGEFKSVADRMDEIENKLDLSDEEKIALTTLQDVQETSEWIENDSPITEAGENLEKNDASIIEVAQGDADLGQVDFYDSFNIIDEGEVAKGFQDVASGGQMILGGAMIRAEEVTKPIQPEEGENVFDTEGATVLNSEAFDETGQDLRETGDKISRWPGQTAQGVATMGTQLVNEFKENPRDAFSRNVVPEVLTWGASKGAGTTARSVDNFDVNVRQGVDLGRADSMRTVVDEEGNVIRAQGIDRTTETRGIDTGDEVMFESESPWMTATAENTEQGIRQTYVGRVNSRGRASDGNAEGITTSEFIRIDEDGQVGNLGDTQRRIEDFDVNSETIDQETLLRIQRENGEFRVEDTLSTLDGRTGDTEFSGMSRTRSQKDTEVGTQFESQSATMNDDGSGTSATEGRGFIVNEEFLDSQQVEKVIDIGDDEGRSLSDLSDQELQGKLDELQQDADNIWGQVEDEFQDLDTNQRQRDGDTEAPDDDPWGVGDETDVDSGSQKMRARRGDNSRSQGQGQNEDPWTGTDQMNREAFEDFVENQAREDAPTRTDFNVRPGRTGAIAGEGALAGVDEGLDEGQVEDPFLGQGTQQDQDLGQDLGQGQDQGQTLDQDVTQREELEWGFQTQQGTTQQQTTETPPPQSPGTPRTDFPRRPRDPDVEGESSPDEDRERRQEESDPEQMTEYNPSVAGIYFGASREEAPEESLTGLEIRGVVDPDADTEVNRRDSDSSSSSERSRQEDFENPW